MVDLPRKKVGIIACSGEELAEGTVTRLAALRVLERSRPDDTVTICLPLFLAGGEGDRAFARFYPTIAVDGCGLRCAARATERYSNKPAASILVSELIEEHQLEPPQGRRHLNPAGLKAVDLTAERITEVVDELLGKAWSRGEGQLIALETLEEHHTEAAQEAVVATCACGSGIPIQIVVVGGSEVTIAGLPLIFQQFYEAGKAPTEANILELMDTIKIYNPIPAGEEPAYKEAIQEAYRKFWFTEKDR
jgi:uncharacterized metal-binding protein